MKSHEKITIIRNRHRARELRLFRELVETYFERADYSADGMPVDWEGAQVARAQIHRLLPRVIQVVHAAGVGKPTATTTDPGPPLGNVEVLRSIFSARHAGGGGQEILDVIDMALGVYENSRFEALGRTLNPLHYAVTALGFVASLPRRVFVAFGLWPQRRALRIGPEDVARLEAVASRLADTEELIERRFAEVRDRQGQQLVENARELAELAERLDFTERVLAQQQPLKSLKAPDENDVATPA